MKKIEVTIWSDSKEVFTTDQLIKSRLSKLNKKSKMKLYNFSIFALALIDIPTLVKDDRLKVTESGAKLLGFGGKTQFIVFIGLMFLIVALEPMLKLIKNNRKETRKSILDRWGYTEKLKEESLLKDILIIAGCILLLFIPFLLF